MLYQNQDNVLKITIFKSKEKVAELEANYYDCTNNMILNIVNKNSNIDDANYFNQSNLSMKFRWCILIFISSPFENEVIAS